MNHYHKVYGPYAANPGRDISPLDEAPENGTVSERSARAEDQFDRPRGVPRRHEPADASGKARPEPETPEQQTTDSRPAGANPTLTSDAPDVSAPEDSQHCPEKASHDDVAEQETTAMARTEAEDRFDRPRGVPSTYAAASAPPDTSTEPEDTGQDMLRTESFNVPGFLRSTGWFMTIGFLAALLVLYVVAHCSIILANAMALPALLRLPAMLAVWTVLGAIGYVLFRAGRAMIHLSRSFQLDIKQVRNHAGQVAPTAYGRARNKFLEPFLRKLLDRRDDFAKRFGSDKEIMEARRKIEEKAEWLLEPGNSPYSGEWMQHFTDDVQQPMEKMCRKRINHYAKLVLIKTAASPWPFIDIAAVWFNAARMIGDAAVIFNRRFSRTDTLRILIEVSVMTMVAGQSQEALDSIAREAGEGSSDTAAEATGSLLDAAFKSAGEGVAALLKGLGKKAAEGSANWLLMRRLGTRTIDLLKPVRGWN